MSHGADWKECSQCGDIGEGYIVTVIVGNHQLTGELCVNHYREFQTAVDKCNLEESSKWIKR